ncbi:Sm-like ribonucleoprotein [Penicillium lividum]|nr:Sm-like ribonucleoprotein [Penicillium lividum]
MAANNKGKMANLINYRMRVTLNDGRQMTGQMLAFDKHMNLVLADTEEFRRIKRKSKPTAGSTATPQVEAEEKRTLGLTIVRGAQVVSCSVDGPLLPIPLPVSVTPVPVLVLPLSLPALVSASPLVVACPLDSVVLLLVSVALLPPVASVVSLREASPVRLLRDSLVVEDPQVDLLALLPLLVSFLPVLLRALSNLLLASSPLVRDEDTPRQALAADDLSVHRNKIPSFKLAEKNHHTG